MNLGERLKCLRNELLGEKFTMKSFGEKLGVSGDVIKNIEYNRVEIKDHMIKLICQTFNVNEEWLRNGTEPIFKEDNKEKSLIDIIEEEYSLNPLSKKIIETYLNLDKKEQLMFENFAKKLFEENNVSSDITQIPKYTLNNTAEEELSITIENNIVDLQDIKIHDTPVSAGKGSFMNDYEPYNILKVDARLTPQARRCDFALKVRGDSMEPYYYDGDIVFVKEQPSLDNGQIGIFIYEDEAYIKKYSVQEDGVYLISLNKIYPPIKIDENNTFKICGLVLR